MWQSAELWCLPASVMSRWYFAARVGSMRRAWPAAMNSACRRTASPRLVGPPCRLFRPEASRIGTRPVKARAPAREVNRFGSPSRPRIAAAVIVATPGAEVRMPARVGVLEQHCGAFVEVFDLLGQLQRQPGLDRDVLGQVGVVQLAAGPQLEGLLGCGEQCVGVWLAPGAAGVPVAEPGQPGPAEPFHHMRVGIAGGEELQRGAVGQVGADRVVPGRPEDLQQRVQPGQALAAAVGQGRVQLRRPLQRITRPQALLGIQAVGVQHRQPGQQLGVQPVGLGVLGVVAAQIGRPFRRHQHHWRRGAGTRRPAAPTRSGLAPSPPTPRPGRCRRAAWPTAAPGPAAWFGTGDRSR